VTAPDRDGEDPRPPTLSVLGLLGRLRGHLVSVVDAEGRTSFVTRSVTDVLGWEPETFAERAGGLIHPEDLPAMRSAWREVVDRPGNEVAAAFRLRHADGGWRQIEAVAVNALDHPALRGVVWDLRDVTRQREVEQELARSEERFRTMLERSYDVFVVVDTALAVRWTSARLTETMGWEPEEVLGRPVLDYVHPEDRDRAAHSLAEAMAGGRPEDPATVRARCRDGSWRWFEAVGADLTANEAVNGFVLCLRDVTHRQEAELARRAADDRLRALVQHTTEGIFGLSVDGVIGFAYPDSDVLGHPVGNLVGAEALDLVHPADRGAVEAALREITRRPGDSVEVSFRAPDAEGRWHRVEATLTNMLDDAAVGAIVANCRDVTDHHEARQTADRLLAIFELTEDLVAIAAPDGRVTHVNAALRRRLGLESEVEPGSFAVWDHISEADHARVRDEVLPALTGVGIWSGELLLRTTGDGELPVLAQFLAHRDPDGGVAFYSAVMRDISERKAFEARLEHQATHDPLTGLPNRTLLLDRLTVALARARRHGTRLAVLFCDLDQFKVINDSRGHPFGDRLLRDIAARLRSALRPEDTVARFGGDEFVVLTEDLGSEEDAIALGRRIQEVLAERFDVDGTEVFLGTSVGIAYHRPRSGDADGEPQDGSRAVGSLPSPESLLREADTAMYRAKERGRGGIVVFDETLRSRTLRRLEIETDLRRALERGELVLHFQPVVDLATGTIRHLEALVRWHHPQRGLLVPVDFVSIAEDSGLIVPIGAWILEAACHQLGEWRARGVARTDLGVSVNLSGRQFSDPTLPDRLAAVLSATGLPPGTLTLEITESLLMDDVELSQALLGRLKDLEVRVAVDDFGTGYSSLSYLRSFPVDELKIDRSFVSGLGPAGGDEAIVAAVVRLAESLGLDTVAEGVETEAQRQQLLRLGCRFGQGHRFAPATPPEAVPTLLG
jgi:diguanylate cyclase (GGDEF)-like protein/PAS domain S-box-containing protein